MSQLTGVTDQLGFPFEPSIILKKKKSIKRELLKQPIKHRIKVAILGGSTTAEIKDILEVFLLSNGITATFYESQFNRFYEEATFENPDLKAFNPDIVYIHTTIRNILYVPNFQDSAKNINEKTQKEISRLTLIWETIQQNYGCTIIQNNFELPPERCLGNLDFSCIQGMVNFISKLNSELVTYAQKARDFHINDIHYLASYIGLHKWHDPTFWYSYRYAMSYEAISYLCYNLTSIINSSLGNRKKCLILDLDNTLWHGVIGDDGLAGIKIGSDTAIGEAHLAFQNYVLALKEQGIILAICSKNEEKNALEGLSHSGNALKKSDFAVIKANWEPKHQNISEIANELNIGLNSLVFIDDNPVERDLVRNYLPQVSVPEIGSEPEKYIQILDKSSLFEPTLFSQEDLLRNQMYKENKKRQTIAATFSDYHSFLCSLTMTSHFDTINASNIDRSVQLINKTNQFNLTTKRYSLSDLQTILHDKKKITFCADLTDKFGSNGIVSVLLGEIKEQALHITVWLMSCRVIKRDLEFAMFDVLQKKAIERGVKQIFGYYYKTPKNEMVSNHYQQMGFSCIKKNTKGDSIWVYELKNELKLKNKIIKVVYEESSYI